MKLSAIVTFIGALLKFLSAATRYAAGREAKKSARAMVMVGVLEQLTKDIDYAIKTGRDFDQRLRNDPDWLFSDDGFKRPKTSHRIRDSTNTD